MISCAIWKKHESVGFMRTFNIVQVLVMIIIFNQVGRFEQL